MSNWPGNKKIRDKPIIETEETKELSATEIYELRTRTMKDQDQALDNMLKSVGTQKKLAVLIGEESDSSRVLMSRMGDGADRETFRIEETTARVEKVNVESSTKALWICICFLVLVFLIVLFLCYVCLN